MRLLSLSRRLKQEEDGFLWATPTAVGLMLMISAMARVAFWLPPLEGAPINVSSHLASLFALPFGIAAVMILAAKRRTPGPAWQHSHWRYHLHTLSFSAIGGCLISIILFPAVTDQSLSIGRAGLGALALLGVSGGIIWRTLWAIRASRRQLPISA
jgi:hypothetical protein